MAVSKLESNTSVLDAAKTRIKNAFSNGIKIYLSFSCGKDSLVMSSLVYDLIMAGEIDRKLLTVVFIDEEGLYPSMVDAAMRWRKKFTQIGVDFQWYCLPFKQVCTLDHLSSSESWITWEPGKEDVWMRTPPSFAIMTSPYLHYAGEMNYQTFSKKAFRDGISMVGVRTSESMTRLKAVSQKDPNKPDGLFYPIYDWKDQDVWLYIKEHNLEFPEIYMRLFEAGCDRRQLRLCAFFGDMTTQGLRWVAETNNELWEKIERRMPNAYLVLLYWDSEMFRRSSRKRKELEQNEEKKDYKELCKDLLFINTDKYTIAPDTKKRLGNWKKLFKQTFGVATQKHYKKMYEAILYGDPKGRVLRILWGEIFNDFANATKGAENERQRT